MVFSIFGQKVPYCYDIGFNPLNNGIILDVHNDFADSMPVDGSKIKQLKKEYRFLKSFSWLPGNFGFDDAFIRQKTTRKNIARYLMPIPKASTVDEVPWAALRRTAISLAFFSDMARSVYRKGTSSKQDQLLAFFVLIDEANGRIGIMGDYSSRLCRWFGDGISRGDLESVTEAMRQTYYHIWDREMHGHFGTYINEEGQLILQCPFDGTLYVFSDHDGKYMEFSSNQLPNISVLLSLISGLAAVNGIARREMA